MAGRYPVAVINYAREMYETGFTLDAIADAVSRRTERPTNRSMVHNWAMKYSWYRPEWSRSAKHTSPTPAIDRESENDLGHPDDWLEEYRKAYRRLWLAGLNQLGEMKARNPREAAAMIDIGLRGEMRIPAPGVLPKWVDQILLVFKEEVEDEEAMSRVAARLKGMAGEMRQQPVN